MRRRVRGKQDVPSRERVSPAETPHERLPAEPERVRVAGDANVGRDVRGASRVRVGPAAARVRPAIAAVLRREIVKVRDGVVRGVVRGRARVSPLPRRFRIAAHRRGRVREHQHRPRAVAVAVRERQLELQHQPGRVARDVDAKVSVLADTDASVHADAVAGDARHRDAAVRAHVVIVADAQSVDASTAVAAAAAAAAAVVVTRAVGEPDGFEPGVAVLLRGDELELQRGDVLEPRGRQRREDARVRRERVRGRRVGDVGDVKKVVVEHGLEGGKDEGYPRRRGRRPLRRVRARARAGHFRADDPRAVAVREVRPALAAAVGDDPALGRRRGRVEPRARRSRGGVFGERRGPRDGAAREREEREERERRAAIARVEAHDLALWRISRGEEWGERAPPPRSSSRRPIPNVVVFGKVKKR